MWLCINGSVCATPATVFTEVPDVKTETTDPTNNEGQKEVHGEAQGETNPTAGNEEADGEANASSVEEEMLAGQA